MKAAGESTTVMLLVVLFLALSQAPLCRAEEKPESQTPLQDKLMIRGGWAYVFGATANVAVGGPVLGVGTNVDFTQRWEATAAPMPSASIPCIDSTTVTRSGFHGIGSA